MEDEFLHIASFNSSWKCGCKHREINPNTDSSEYKLILDKFKNKLDPRKYNGAIFLGLESPVVKSHGATDEIGFAHSINVCHRIVKSNLIEKIKSNLITVEP